jgi:hypothetical protein
MHGGPPVRVKIKGSALLARKEIVTRRFGVEAWTRLVQDMAVRHPCFRSPVVASSLLPVGEFLEFHDELVERFFKGDANVYFQLGEQSAQWALTKGPYKRFLARKDLDGFVASIPNLSNAYWDEATTSYRATIDGDVVEFEVSGLPEWHPYFEYLVVGYIKAALELLCGPIDMEQLKGGSGTEYHYRFRKRAARQAL